TVVERVLNRLGPRHRYDMPRGAQDRLIDRGCPRKRAQLVAAVLLHEQVAINLGLHARDTRVHARVGDDPIHQLEVAVDRGVVPPAAARSDGEWDPEPTRTEKPE